MNPLLGAAALPFILGVFALVGGIMLDRGSVLRTAAWSVGRGCRRAGGDRIRGHRRRT